MVGRFLTSTLPSNFILLGNFASPSNFIAQPPVIAKDIDIFLGGVSLFYAYGKDVVDPGGTTYSCV
jgi:hypothetical protein